jgi:hypothetical protein
LLYGQEDYRRKENKKEEYLNNQLGSPIKKKKAEGRVLKRIGFKSRKCQS